MLPILSMVKILSSHIELRLITNCRKINIHEKTRTFFKNVHIFYFYFWKNRDITGDRSSLRQAIRNGERPRKAGTSDHPILRSPPKFLSTRYFLVIFGKNLLSDILQTSDFISEYRALVCFGTDSVEREQPS